MPKAEGTCGKSRKGLYSGHFPSKAELAFFHFLEIVTGLLVPSGGQKILVQPDWYLSPQKISLAENRFLQAGKGAANTNTEKSRQCFTYFTKRRRKNSEKSFFKRFLKPQQGLLDFGRDSEILEVVVGVLNLH